MLTCPRSAGKPGAKSGCLVPERMYPSTRDTASPMKQGHTHRPRGLSGVTLREKQTRGLQDCHFSTDTQPPFSAAEGLVSGRGVGAPAAAPQACTGLSCSDGRKGSCFQLFHMPGTVLGQDLVILTNCLRR